MSITDFIILAVIVWIFGFMQVSVFKHHQVLIRESLADQNLKVIEITRRYRLDKDHLTYATYVVQYENSNGKLSSRECKILGSAIYWEE